MQITLHDIMQPAAAVHSPTAQLAATLSTPTGPPCFRTAFPDLQPIDLPCVDVGIPNAELSEPEGAGSPAVKHTFEDLEPKIAVPAMVIPHEGEVNKARWAFIRSL
jgi:hypothetical protein